MITLRIYSYNNVHIYHEAMLTTVITLYVTSLVLISLIIGSFCLFTTFIQLLLPLPSTSFLFVWLVGFLYWVTLLTTPPWPKQLRGGFHIYLHILFFVTLPFSIQLWKWAWFTCPDNSEDGHPYISQGERPGTDPALIAFRRNQPCQYFHFWLLAFKTVRQMFVI